MTPWRTILSWEVDPSPQKIKKMLVDLMTTANDYATSSYDCTIKWKIDNQNVVAATFFDDVDPNDTWKYKITYSGEYQGHTMITIQEMWNKGQIFHLTAIPSHVVAIMYAA